VTGAIAASALFFFLVFLAKKVEFVPEVAQQDGFARGTLTSLELERGRPVYFEVTGEADTVSAGRKPDPGTLPPDALDQIFGNGKEKTHAIVIHLDRGIGIDSAVIGSRYNLRGVEHIDLRNEGDSLKPAYDAQHLPRFLFLGAGLMTLATLLVLWKRLPDLMRRAAWVLRSLIGPRVLLTGVHYVPSEGPIVLVLTTSDPALHAAVRSATDRYTRIFMGDPAQGVPAASLLTEGGIAGVVLDGPKGDELLRNLSQRHGFDIVPVYAVHEAGKLLVAFGPPVPGSILHDTLRAKIDEARTLRYV